jgi:site-specific recombinase XerD
MVRVQKIRVPDTGRLSWILIDGEHLPVGVVNEYLLYLHRLGRSSNTVRAYAHHLQAYWTFLVEQKHDWRYLKLTQLAEFVSWARHATRAGGGNRSDTTINLILAAIGSFYEYQDRLGVETAISRSRRFGAKSPYKAFLHHISRTQSLRHPVVRVKAIKRLPRVFSPSEVQSLLDSCTRLRDRFLLCLLHESGMRIGQALGLRHADIQSYDGTIEIVPRANSNGTSSEPELSLFSYTKRGCMSPVPISETFHSLVPKLELHIPPGVSPPRVHDLRHSFAVATLPRWYREGIDPNCRLMSLSTFLGHVDPDSTAVYLTITEDLIHEAAQRLHVMAPKGGMQ